MAKKLFETFKKRYLKKKGAWKRANRSGTSTAAVDKAQNAYELYKFFHWYDEFQRPRSVVTNSKAPRNHATLNLEDSINSNSDEEEKEEMEDSPSQNARSNEGFGKK